MVGLGLRCCTGVSLVAASRGYTRVVGPGLHWGCSLVGMQALLIVMASLVVEHGLRSVKASRVAAPRLESTGSGVVVRRLSCSTACGIFGDEALNSCLLHRQADSLPLGRQGCPHGILGNIPGSLSFLIYEMETYCLSELSHLKPLL